MTANDEPEVSSPIAEAEVVRRELQEALSGAGVELPSLGLDPLSCTGPVPRPLVDLGRCNLAVARELAVVLRAYAARGWER
ncbi:hypothetical protein E0L36_19715 [Streptomyces sp. AJS327]|uniref:hypothetical protein n=1 Tax=Streptomyces sp. AJS327 TaxID=2545265 RepID=UPI0015DFAB51|nr:hypothetical protein [Streptomyces sp. AJS327]MBA0053019.1 hypothetical protein [Streptomyces sp. AJS327]